jgi:hypothetical protein
LKKESEKTMNKKYMAFLLPLLVMPMFAFGYAHFTDDVVKKYKIHVGTVFLTVTGFHVDNAIMPDADSDGVIWGDELTVNIHEATDGTYYVEIRASPITGGFVLDTTMWMHNDGKLPFKIEFTDIKWDGPYDTEPTFDVPPNKELIGANPLPMPPWSWSMTVYRWVKDPVTGVYSRNPPTPAASTQLVYEPCDYIEVIQHIDFQQPGATDTWQEEWGCKWITLWVKFHATDWVEPALSSQTWGTLGPPPPP